MLTGKSRFALYFGNRGFFPASLMATAREELSSALNELGHETLMLDADATRFGAVETPQEGEVYAKFLKANEGKFDGIILSLPNFGDENGAVAAFKDADVPIFIQGYPDDLDRMDPAQRRDSFCGKFSIMDVFYQNDIEFTALTPHVVHPSSPRFAENIQYFDRLCRVVKRMRRMTIGALGARTTAFKTVRIDELALQRHGITMETVDMSDVFARVRAVEKQSDKAKAKAEVLAGYTSWKGVPEESFDNIVRLGVAIDDIVEEMKLDAIAIRCWIELQKELKVSCCVLLGEMNDRGITAACEVDVGSGVTMHALAAASGDVATCLDWNNNYGDEDDKCILFHCGPVPQSMMTAQGQIVDHAILQATAGGPGCAIGCNQGRIAPMPMSYGNVMTDEGLLNFYLGEGRFTGEPIPDEYFGCAGVAEISDLQRKLLTIGYQGHRHHVAVTPGHVMEPVVEAFDKYLGYEVTVL